MSIIAGSIEIQMLADLARLKRDMDSAKGMVGSATQEMQRAANMVKAALGGMVAGLSVSAFASMVKGSIDAAEALHDLAIQTGATVEGLSAMQDIGRLTGTAPEQIAKAMNKLSLTLSTTKDESQGAGKALKALGLDLESLRALRGEQQILELARALEQFEAGGGKSAAVMTLLGKEGATLLPFLKDLANAGALVATVTAEQAAMADQYNDAMETASIRVDALKREVALGLLPTLIDLHDLTMDLATATRDYMAGGADKASGEFDALALAIGGVGVVMETLLVLGANVAFVLRGVGREIGGVLAQIAQISSGNFSGAAAIHDAMRSDAASARAALDAYEQRVLGSTARALQARSALRGGSVSAADQAREMDRLQRAAGGAARGQLQFSASSDAAARSSRQHADEVSRLTARLRERSAEQEQQLELQREEARLQADILADRERIGLEVVAETERLREQVAAQSDQNLALVLGAEGFQALQQARLRSRADELEAIATTSDMSAELREQAALLRERADLMGEHAKLSADVAKPLANDTYTEVRDALARAFRDTRNPIRAFGDALGNVVFTRVASNLADALATQLVGSSGTGGMFGSLISGLGSLFGAGTGAGFDSVATPLARGMDSVPYDGFRALLHRGERVVPAAEAAGAAAARGTTYAPVTNIQVDSRSDRAAVQQDVARIVAEGNARQLQELRRMGVV